ncbi:hypothetical protein [Thermococcus piezophilus]|uniref:hypothetical protein n=1 Tax=Thermococcus piezophilus TaxID=1712654 RepID=UPI0019007307|nr:hypothetical protein [Thermococcus piezophilus]
MEELITENYPECYDEISCEQLVKLAGKYPIYLRVRKKEPANAEEGEKCGLLYEFSTL